MSGYVSPLTDITIPTGASVSNTLLANREYRDAASMTLHAPDTLPDTVTIDVAADEAGTNWNPLVRGGTNVTIAAGTSITIDALSFPAMRLRAGAPVAADRTFKATKFSFM